MHTAHDTGIPGAALLEVSQMKIVITFGLLITWLLVAFFLGVVAGVRIAATVPHEQVLVTALAGRGQAV